MSQREREDQKKQIDEQKDYNRQNNNDVVESEKMQSPEPWPEPTESDNEGDN